MGYERHDSRRRRSVSGSPDHRRDRGHEQSNGASRSRSPHLSKYYRERFGNQSPNHYNNLRISNFDGNFSKDEVRRILEKLFSDYKDFEIKMVKRENERDSFAYVNFEEAGCAKDIRRNKINSLKKMLGRNVYLDPTGVVVDQEGKYIPDRYNRSLMDRRSPEQQRRSTNHREHTPEKRHRRSSPPPPVRRASPPRRRKSTPPVAPRRSSPRASPSSNKDAPSRTLFLGNIPPMTNEKDIRDACEKYGQLEDMEVKQAEGGVALYCFVVYVNMRNAVAARRALDGSLIGKDASKKVRAGFGRSQPSRRLWVGDLGSWTTRSMLENEFDRYGQIEDLEYVEGDEYGYVTFADSNGASDALLAMNDFMLDKGHRILVDYARIIHEASRKRRRSDSSERGRTPPKKSKGPRTPSPRESRSPTRTPSPIRSGTLSRSENGAVAAKIASIDALKKQKMSTWKGFVMLKKAEYPIYLHRISGSEEILQDYLRDDEGRALKLTLNQRLPMDENLFEKLSAFTGEDFAVAIAVERDRSLSSLLAYLKEKKAAGVVSNANVITYLLYNNSIAQRLIRHYTPEIDIPPADSHFLVIIKKT